MIGRIIKRWFSGFAAAVMTVSNIAPAVPIRAEDTPDLTYQSIELYPNGEDAEQVVTLDGMMPEGAEAEAVDVSDEHDGIAAYDITITDGWNEYQPGEENPILVEISDPVITENIELWHIHDDGFREQLFDFTAEEGKVSFYATGFSVYEIVEETDVKPLEGDFGWKTVKSLADVANKGEDGLYVSNQNGKYYLTGGFIENVTNDRSGLEATTVDTAPLSPPDEACKFYFEQVKNTNNQFYIYKIDKDEANNDIISYVQITTITSGTNTMRGGLKFVTKKSDDTHDGTPFTLEYDNNSFYCSYVLYEGADAHYWNRNTKDNQPGKYAIAAYQKRDDGNIYKLQLHYKNYIPKDPYKLNGKTFGLMRYVSGATGRALMAADNNAMELLAYVIRPDSAGDHESVYVAEDADISEWTFENVAEDRYYIYSDFTDVRKYLKISDSGISFETVPIGDPIPDGLEIQVVPDNKGRVKLVSKGKSLKLNTITDGAGNKSARFQSAAVNDGDFLSLVTLTELPEHNKVVTYKAKEVSVSEVKNGEELIIYTRVWDTSDSNNPHYEFYALAHDGTLVPCYERGDSIMWLSGKMNTLIWEFTEYYYAYTSTPNYYYELYNPYSQKYIAPIRPNGSLSSGQVLGDEKVGINLPGRKEGNFYTDILAWDDVSYSYSGLGINTDALETEPTTRHLADTFYFARLVDLKNELTEVKTINNNDYGITMKMVDFAELSRSQAQDLVNAAADANSLSRVNIKNSSYGSAAQSSFTWNYLGGNYAEQQGLLSTKLGDDGYPSSQVEKYNNLEQNDVIPNPAYQQSIASAFASASVVNHLFIQSILEQSGYFEFDSCQNYATLKQADGSNGTDFFVSKEIGTHDATSKSSLQHGQFFPYDDIDMDNYAALNKENLYTATLDELSDDDPRKFEKLHLIHSPDYYFGMELEASFTQTPNGKDNWGHDIIFEFTGDDDFWLYVDDELIIDLGGTHPARAGNVNFATGDVVVKGVKTNLREVFRKNYITRHPDATEAEIHDFLAEHFAWDEAKQNFETVFIDYTKHTMKIFYMERGASASNLHMRFNLSYIKPGDVVLTKEISGTEDLDFEMIEYPFQIRYRFDENGEEHILGNEKDETQDTDIFITYENSTKTVERVQDYIPPGSRVSESYTSVFFINPKNKAVIHFPIDTYQYKIIECGMDRDIYDWATINNVVLNPTDGTAGGTGNGPQVKQNGDRYDYESAWMTVSEQGFATYNNHVDKDGLRKLRFTKELYDNDYVYNRNNTSSYKEDHKMTAEQDPTTFTFRLYLSNRETENLPLAYMVSYRVLDPENYYCTWDSITQKFERYVYDGEFVNIATLDTLLESETVSKEALLKGMTFECSMNGSISKIPAWYTVEVPNLPVGLLFMVEERDTKTERPLGYERVIYERDTGTYDLLENGVENKGRIQKDKSPALSIINQRGYELQAVKNWSDKDSVSGHDDIFTALYVKENDGSYTLAENYIQNPVRRLSSPNTEVRYFMNTLRDKTKPEIEKSLSDFQVFEVKLSGDYTVDEKGLVTLGSNAAISKIEDGGVDLIIPAADRVSEKAAASAVFQNAEFLDINNASSWSVQKQFDWNANLYGDRNIKAAKSGIPIYLLGAEYLRTANDSKSLNDTLCTFTAGTDADIYVAWDARSAPNPSWLNIWTQISDTIQTSTAPSVTMNLYKKTVTQGTNVTLGANIGGTAPAGTYNNYIVLAVPKYDSGRIITDLTPSNDNWTIQQFFDSSTFPYNDRDIRVDSKDFPEKFSGAEYLRTTAAAGTHTLKADINAVIYVAIDEAISPVPDWLNDWTKIKDTIKTSDNSSTEKRTMAVYSKSVNENETVTLGANSVSGSENPYFVLALPSYTYSTEYSTGNETEPLNVLKGSVYAEDAGCFTGLYYLQDDEYHLADAAENPIRKLEATDVSYYLKNKANSIDGYQIFKLNLSGYRFVVQQDGSVTQDGSAPVAAGSIEPCDEDTPMNTNHSQPDSGNNAEITAVKEWSSSDGDAVFTALFQLRNGSYHLVDPSTVRRLSAPVTKVSYSVNVPPDLPEGVTQDAYLETYQVFEVKLDGNGYLVDQNGFVTQISESGHSEPFSESRIQRNGAVASTPTTFTARDDTISNTRQGGIEIDLYKMGTRNKDDNPNYYGDALEGGVFELYHDEELIGTYVSDRKGRITVMYNFVENENYTLKQTAAPKSYIGLQEPVIFKVYKNESGNGSVEFSKKTESGYEQAATDEWKNYHMPSGGDRLVAYIDIYNKPFKLKAIKIDSKEVDSAGNPKPIEGVRFALYYGVRSIDGWIPGSMMKPEETDGILMTNENGEIANISEALEEGVYFLKEVSAKSGYKIFDRYIRINVRENDVDIRSSNDDPTAYEKIEETAEGTITTVTLNSGVKLIKTDDQSSRTCEIMIPNEKVQSDYYFDIEKIIFVDKNIHDSDTEQKFVFRVDRFSENETSFTDEKIQASFYITLNCDKKMTYTNDSTITLGDSPYSYRFYHDATDSDAPRYVFASGSDGVEITKTYNTTDSYTFPAEIWNGRQTVHVAQKGIYRISEVNNWSATDYDFWKGSNRYKGFGDGAKGEAIISSGFRDSKTTDANALPEGDEHCVYINVAEVKADEFRMAQTTISEKEVLRPTASFTNTETEYAYLSSQAYAENTFKKQ